MISKDLLEQREEYLITAEKQNLVSLGKKFMLETQNYKYVYNFDWAGRPIIQFPQDIVQMQEIILSVKPDVIIETGIAHGGSLAFSASMLALLDYMDAVEAGKVLDPKQTGRKVIGIDIDIRDHNRRELDSHPLRHKMVLLQGSSIDSAIIEQVKAQVSSTAKVLVILDSNHTHDHVLKELEAYAPLVNVGSYCIVFDTAIEDMPKDTFGDRPWGPGNSPKTAVYAFLKDQPQFSIDFDIQNRLLITVGYEGYLKRTK